MKLVGEGRAVGIALSDDTGTEKVLVLLQIGNHKLDLAGKSASTTAMLTTGNVDLNANGVAIYNIKSLASANGTWSIDENGRLSSRQIKTEELCVGDVCVDRGRFLQMVQSAGIVATTTTPLATSTLPGTTSSPTVQTNGSSTVIQPDPSIPVSSVDTEAPTITLNGQAMINLTVGDTYTEEGALAFDNVDPSVVVNLSGTVDTATAGTYTITYTATDSAGNIGTVTRQVIVLTASQPTTEAPAQPTTETSNQAPTESTNQPVSEPVAPLPVPVDPAPPVTP
jgi:hypothetical protein